MADYRYHFYDLRTGAKRDTLPVENVAFGGLVSGIGEFSGEIPLGADGLDSQRVMDVVKPWRTKVYAERDNALVWGGWIHEQPSYDSGTRRLSISAEETLGYFVSRKVPTAELYGQDQLVVARWLISGAQAADGGNVGLLLGSELSGVIRDRVYAIGDDLDVLAALTQLSEVLNGFEFRTQVAWESGVPVERLVLGYPRLGRPRAGAAMVLEYIDSEFGGGGNVDHYEFPKGTGFATRATAKSETDEGVALSESATSTGLIAAGYPLIERTDTYDNVNDSATLRAHASAQLLASAGGRAAATFTVHARKGGELGDWALGDDLLTRITDWRYPPTDPETGAPGFKNFLRVVGYEVQPGVEGAETYALTMSERIDPL